MGGVIPYDISIDTTGNVKTITIVDYDGCVSTTQFTLSGVTAEDLEGIKIYPNPASKEIYIELTGNIDPIEGLRIFSKNGQVL